MYQDISKSSCENLSVLAAEALLFNRESEEWADCFDSVTQYS
jgi:hypothetical protein